MPIAKLSLFNKTGGIENPALRLIIQGVQIGVFQKFVTTECYQQELSLRNSTSCSI